MSTPDSNDSLEVRFQGIGVSPGIVTGKVFIYGRTDIPVNHRRVREEEIPDEIKRLENALAVTRGQLQEIKNRVAEDLGESDAILFDAHMLVLEDPMLVDEVVKEINQCKNAESAFETVSNLYIKSLSAVSDEYLSERAADIRDVAHRVIRNLQGNQFHDLRAIEEPCIVLSYDLSPSDTAMLNRQMVIGFGTDIGSKTSHTAIMARAMNIPAVVGLHDASQQVEPGAMALLDGYSGLLIINPTEQTLFEYGQIEIKRHSIEVSLESLRDLPAETADHIRLQISANIELPNDIPHVIMSGADGVGLFRSEYLFISRDELPSEEEQFAAYFEVAEKLHPRPIVIRTLDLGGDKFLSQLQIPNEMNPFMGWRAIRFCLERTDIFRTQLRAILRASALGNVRIMYPMISGIRELRMANMELEYARNELREEKVYFDEKLQVGSMIEVPSAAVISDLLAKECDFFSIGTNDLIQYSLAVDRVNEKIAHLYEPTHPAIIRLIHHIAESANHAKIKVSICGEMAGDVALAPLLLGLGVDELSTSPMVVPQLKKIIRSMEFIKAQEIARRSLELHDSQEIRQLSSEYVKSVAPDVMELIGQ